MCLKKLIAVTLVMSIAAVSVIAQPVTQLNKGDSKITAAELENKRSQTITYSEATVQGHGHDLSPTAILDGRDLEGNPLILSRSFKNSVKENLDKDTMERLAK